MSDTAVQDQVNVDDVQVPEQNVETVETADAPEVAEVAKANDKYPAKEVGQALGARLSAAHDVGWTRPMIQKLVASVKIEDVSGPAEDADGFTMGGSALWRSRDGRVHDAEVPYLTAVLDWIDAGTVQLPEKSTKNPAKLQERLLAAQTSLDAIKALAEGSTELKKVGELREVLTAIVGLAG